MSRIIVSTVIIFALTMPLQEAQSQENTGYRDPSIPVLFSALLSGGGQFYNGDGKKGALMMVTDLISISSLLVFAIGISYIEAGDEIISDVLDTTPTRPHDAGNPLITGIASVWCGNKIWSMADAGFVRWKINRERGLTANLDVKPIHTRRRRGVMLSYRF